MRDIIKLLPDNISNQIAAGEVIQNPASAIKELIENSIDAQATKITLILKDAGRTLIQVNDDGIGMSHTDARMCFEKHATSKISTIDDLFKIRSNGFRGEALASIAAVSQVELKTRRAEDEIGTHVIIEDSKVLSQEPISIPVGTQILMKNLFYNVPARRNFLKNDAKELNYIVTEFLRLTIAYNNIEFSLYHNDKELYKLMPSSRLKRICNIFGSKYDEKLVPIEEDSDIIHVKGFVCKPQDANSKTKGKQYLYVNNRFIKSQYIQHAIYSAYRDLIQSGEYPFYVIFIDIDPKMIDVNVHPAKQEIKFEDEQLIYGFINAAIRRSLMQYNIAPSIDFTLDKVFQNLDAVSNPMNSTKGGFQIHNESSVRSNRPSLSVARHNEQNWQELYHKSLEDEYYSGELSDIERVQSDKKPAEIIQQNDTIQVLSEGTQIMNKYIVIPTNIGLLMLDQKRAHERIIFDELQKLSLKSAIASQKLLFPICVELDMQDSAVLEDILADMTHLGFDISPMGNNVYAIQGIPADLPQGGEKELIYELIDNFKNNFKAKNSKKETLLISISKISSVKKSQSLEKEEIKYLSDNIFKRDNYMYSPGGKPIFYNIQYQEIEKHFN